jgi:HTH-type transcriptional regulator / antitoxin HigA
MSATLVRETLAAYRRLRRFVPLGVLRSEKDYRKAMAILDKIIDEIGQDEAHPLADLAEALALFIQSYEETHAKIRQATGPEVLRSLMEEHGLTQSELREIGSQGVVSEVLSGEREPNIRQIRRLAKRFGVSPAVFIAFTPLHEAKNRADGNKPRSTPHAAQVAIALPI